MPPDAVMAVMRLRLRASHVAQRPCAWPCVPRRLPSADLHACVAAWCRQAVRQMLEVEAARGEGAYAADTLAVGIARLQVRPVTSTHAPCMPAPACGHGASDSKQPVQCDMHSFAQWAALALTAGQRVPCAAGVVIHERMHMCMHAHARTHP